MNLRVVSWNIGCGYLGESGFMGQDGNAPYVDRISTFLEDLNPDIIFLQEAYDAKTQTHIGSVVAQQLGMFVVDQLYANDQEGMAILSRWPLADPTFKLFPNPDLAVDKGKKGVWRTFDKGVLSAIVRAPQCTFTARTAHVFPVHHFNGAYSENRFSSLRTYIKNHLEGSRLIVGADLNVDTALAVFDVQGMRSCITGVTNPKYNNQTDYVLTSKEFSVNNTDIVHEGADHYCLVADLESEQ